LIRLKKKRHKGKEAKAQSSRPKAKRHKGIKFKAKSKKDKGQISRGKNQIPKAKAASFIQCGTHIVFNYQISRLSHFHIIPLPLYGVGGVFFNGSNAAGDGKFHRFG
jgi:hypothetical protein